MAEELLKDMVGDHLRDNSSSNHNEKEDVDFEDKEKIGESPVTIGDGTSCSDLTTALKSSTSSTLFKVKVKDWFTQTDINRNRINPNTNGTDVTTQAGHIENNREKLHEALLAYCQDTQSQTELELLSKLTQDAAIQKEPEVVDTGTQESTGIFISNPQTSNYEDNKDKEVEKDQKKIVCNNEMAIQHDYSYFGVDVGVQNGNGPGVDIAIQKENLGIDIAIETVQIQAQIQKDQKNIDKTDVSTQKPCETFSSTSTSSSSFENVASQTEKARRQFTQDMLTQYEEIDTLSFPELKHEGVKLTLKKQPSNDDLMTQYENEYEYESLPTTHRLTQFNFLDSQDEEEEKEKEDAETDGFIQPGKIRDSLVTKQMKNSMASCLREQIESLSLNSYSSHHDSEIQRFLNPTNKGMMLNDDDDERKFSAVVKPMEMGNEHETEEEERIIRNNFVQVYKPTIRKKKRTSRKLCLIS